MKNRPSHFFTPFFKTIDRVIFGIEEPKEIEDQPVINEWLIDKKPKNQEEQEDHVAIRSTN